MGSAERKKLTGISLGRMNAREDPNDRDRGVPDINLNGQTVPIGFRIDLSGAAAARGLGLEAPLCPLSSKRRYCVKQARWSRTLGWALVAVTVTSISFWLFARGNQNASRNGDGRAISYEILPDDMNTVIVIGVKADVNERQLRATLAKAADEHQDDAARDYLASMFLWIEANLTKNGRQSSIPAGRLRRYVPPGNPAERRRLKLDRSRGDKYKINLGESRRSFQ